jgi:hypothetical protein
VASAVLAVASAAPPDDGVSPEGLVLRYAFEGLGTDVVRDLSRNGLDGRLDDVRVYSRTLDPTKVTQLARR